MPLDFAAARQHLRDFDFGTLFIQQLGWDHYATPLTVTVDDHHYALSPVAEKRGMVAYTCAPLADGGIPDYATRRKIERQVGKSVHEHLIIYTDGASTAQVWQWVRKEIGKPTACREHRYHRTQPGDALLQKLQAIEFSLEEEEGLTIVDVTSRVRAAFDVERVTKRFYDRFKAEHATFLNFIKGIPDEGLRRWYASVMLNRLMFIYFIQKKGFLDGDLNYLGNRLATTKLSGRNCYYSDFLCPLFFEGFAKRPEERSAAAKERLGTVPYLNGGIFMPHQVEQLHGRTIRIADTAFERLFDFFGQYDWHLDERPLRADNEINPDVLGYIFEKYINQKQMGAYYTKEDITGYISQNTIIPRLFDMARAKCRIAFEGPDVGQASRLPSSSGAPASRLPSSSGAPASRLQHNGRQDACPTMWDLLQADPHRYIYQAVRKGADLPLPPEIAAGTDDVSKRAEWNKAAPPEHALPTEIWREVVARRQRYEEVRGKLLAGEVRDINHLITYNLDIRQFAQDVIENCEGPELLRAFWRAIQSITVLDPAVGSGAFLFAALNILEPLYEACLDRMEAFLDDLKRGAGVPPATAQEAGKMPAPHPGHFVPFDRKTGVSIRARRLPHWRQEGVTYFVTYRLADSVPQEKLRAWQQERDRWLKAHPKPWSPADEAQYHKLFTERMQAYLDAGYGACWLRRPALSAIVENALQHFHGERYLLGRYIVMPNHVHVLVTPAPGHDLSQVLHSWKSYTAKEINKAVGRRGTLWLDESFDHIVRNADALLRFEQYTAENPLNAGLPEGEYRCGAGILPATAPSGARVSPGTHKAAGKMPAPHPHPRKFADFRKVLARVAQHPNRRYFVLKSIIVNNLFGVDIMEEAIEICKLRLFLKLVAQIDVGQASRLPAIEPLPDIDFNIRAGNSLVGYATYDQVKQAVASEFDYEGKMKQIEEKAQDVDRLFARFREQQTELGGEVTAEDKQKLRDRLRALEDELSGSLAGEYAVDPSNAAQFPEWVASHKPFHWFIEFYGIMKSGGFDSIIGNPPYVEYRLVKREYCLQEGLYASEAAGNLYAFFMERSGHLVNQSGWYGMIVPAGVLGVDKATPLRRWLLTRFPRSFCSTFAIRPSKLFEGVDQRLCVYVGNGGPSAGPAIRTTRYHHWHSEERPFLFPLISYCRSANHRRLGRVPQIGSALGVSSFAKLEAQERKTISHYLARRGRGQLLHYHRSPRYWIRAMDFEPHFKSPRGTRSVYHFRDLYIVDGDRAKAIGAALNSSIFFLWFQMVGNGRNITEPDIKQFPVGEFSRAALRELHDLFDQLMQDYRAHSVIRTRRDCEFQEFSPSESKAIMDDIDTVLGQHFGFTGQELDFIINYEIKYRMGLDALQDEEE